MRNQYRRIKDLKTPNLFYPVGLTLQAETYEDIISQFQNIFEMKSHVYIVTARSVKRRGVVWYAE